jgi:hypothetical protein
MMKKMKGGGLMKMMKRMGGNDFDDASAVGDVGGLGRHRWRVVVQQEP